MISNSGRPIRTDHFNTFADRFAESLTGSRSLTESTLDVNDLRVTSHPDTEFMILKFRGDSVECVVVVFSGTGLHELLNA